MGSEIRIQIDLWLYDAKGIQYYKNKLHHGYGSLTSSNNITSVSNDNIGRHRKSSSKKKNFDGNNEVDFKCNVLCLFIPGFGKAKQVRPRKAEEMVMIENDNHNNSGNNVISRTVSLEKFECGSILSRNHFLSK